MSGAGLVRLSVSTSRFSRDRASCAEFGAIQNRGFCQRRRHCTHAFWFASKGKLNPPQITTTILCCPIAKQFIFLTQCFSGLMHLFGGDIRPTFAVASQAFRKYRHCINRLFCQVSCLQVLGRNKFDGDNLHCQSESNCCTPFEPRVKLQG